jgi:hypothetical protein
MRALGGVTFTPFEVMRSLGLRILISFFLRRLAMMNPPLFGHIACLV